MDCSRGHHCSAAGRSRARQGGRAALRAGSTVAIVRHCALQEEWKSTGLLMGFGAACPVLLEYMGCGVGVCIHHAQPVPPFLTCHSGLRGSPPGVGRQAAWLA
jgi:hypothetical protein